MTGPGSPFVGREAQLGALASMFEPAHAGRGQVALVLGEAGIGKTRLSEELAAAAVPAGFRVGWGCCVAGEAPPFWPWNRALRELGLPASLLAGRRARTRPVLFAGIVDALADRAADAPVLVVLEDLHWADPSTLALLRFVVGSVARLRILLVVTARDDPFERSDDVTATLGDLPAAVGRLTLPGLPAAAITTLATDVLGRAPSDEWVHEVGARTGGNPFFVTEVARLEALHGRSATAVPPGVHQVLGRRLTRLPQRVGKVLDAAAVLGDDPDLELVSVVLHCPVEEVVALLDAVVTARLGRWTGDSFAFAHALVRETAYGEMSAAVRAELHRRAALALEERLALLERTTPDNPATERLCAPLAEHWSRAGGSAARVKAAEWSLRAARGAMARMAYEQGATYYRQALAAAGADELTVLLELGEAQVLAGQLTHGRETLYRAAELARHGHRGEELARAVLALGTGVGGFEVDVLDQRQAPMLNAALDALAPGDGVLRAAVMARLSLALAAEQSPEHRAALATAAAEMAARIPAPDVEVSALAALNDALAGPDHAQRRLANAGRMLSMAAGLGDPVLSLLGRRMRLVALLERGELAAVDAEIARYARVVERLQLPIVAWLVPIWRGMRALMEGDFDEAWRLSEAAEAIGLRADSANAAALVYTLREATHMSRGTAADAVAMMQPWEAMIDLYPGIEFHFAAVRAAAGHHDIAREQLRRGVAAGLGVVARDSEWTEIVWMLGEASLTLDERETCRLAYDTLLPYPDLWAVDGIGGACYGVVGHLLGRLADRLGRPEDARRWLSRAVSTYRAAGARRFERDAASALSALDPQAPHPTLAAPAPEPVLHGTFQRVGRVWQLRWHDHSATVPDSKGMHDLAVLLGRAGREVPALDLVEAAGGAPAAAAGGDLGPVLDTTARTAYRSRLVELEDDIATAEGRADLAVATRLRDERDFLLHELRRALGMAGRSRSMGGGAERARKAVTMRIGTALRAIDAVDPRLARHLRAAVTTGRFCAYRPEYPVVWRT